MSADQIKLNGLCTFTLFSLESVFIINTTLCDKVCQRLVEGQWFSLGTPASSINKTDHHDITEIMLQVTLNTINQPLFIIHIFLLLLSLKKLILKESNYKM